MTSALRGLDSNQSNKTVPAGDGSMCLAIVLPIAVPVRSRLAHYTLVSV